MVDEKILRDGTGELEARMPNYSNPAVLIDIRGGRRGLTIELVRRDDLMAPEGAIYKVCMHGIDEEGIPYRGGDLPGGAIYFGKNGIIKNTME